MALGIAALTRKVERLQADMAQALATLELVKEIVSDMPNRADFDAAKAALQQGITDATNRVSADLQALRDQIAAGNPVTDQDLADIQADVQGVANIDAAPTPNPAPSPTRP